MKLREDLERIMLEQYPDMLFKSFPEQLGRAYGRGQTVNRILTLFATYIHEQKVERPVFGNPEWTQHPVDGAFNQGAKAQREKLLEGIEKGEK